MNLPQSEKLNIQALSRAFADMSESYKVFWFNGLMEIVRADRKRATFREIISRMVTSAWYMVSEYHLNLGPADTLEKLVLRAQAVSGLKPSSKPQDILLFLEQTDDPEIRKAMYVLTLNVPFRLQAPFILDFKGKSWNRRQEVIDRINSDPSTMYHFGFGTGLDTEIVISDKWFDYLHINQAIIAGWIEYNMILYLQRRNPNVPGIANKLSPPVERKLEAVKKYWKALAEIGPVRNIYAPDNSLLTKDDISIDHFVPWSYVAHDELWNLVPTTKSLNSSKSNTLPDWDIYFPRLCDVEFEAYRTIWLNEHIRQLFEKCRKEHINSETVDFRLYKPGIEKNEYTARLEELILPAYTAAGNSGFAQWQL